MEVIEKIYHNEQEFTATAIALGYFDGVHIGHQSLIEATRSIAQKKQLKSVVFTFKEHPSSILSSEKAPKLLSSNSKKIEIVESLGIDYMALINFTKDIMNSTPKDFIENILVKIFHVKHVVVGFNYRFGYKGRGTPKTLIKFGEKYGFDVTVVEPVAIEGKTVSSTLIRNLIQEGEVKKAGKYLGRFYSIKGKVIFGKGLGKKISIPTANIDIDPQLILPKAGVYHTQVIHEHKKYHAVTNVGFNPTFKNHAFTIESHLLGFHQDIYHEEIEILFLKRIRSEMKFNSIETLVSQIKKDIELVQNKELNF